MFHLGLATPCFSAAPSSQPAAGFAGPCSKDCRAHAPPGLGTGRLCADSSLPSAAGSTCCCMRDFFGFCFTWACCPLPEATCCDDHQHCCPSNLPVCDTTAGRCLSSAGQGYEGSVEWSTKTPAMTQVIWFAILICVQRAVMLCATSSSHIQLLPSGVRHQDLCHDQGHFLMPCTMQTGWCCVQRLKQQPVVADA